jgi:uncharacterized protein YndB with AHSA1/START domain
MTNLPTLDITTPSDREVRVVRTFDARRELVFRAWTEPELVKRWMAGPEGWSVTKSEGEPRTGGTYRVEWSGPDDAFMGMTGTYREFVPPARLVTGEVFDEEWYAGEAIVTAVFNADAPDRTTVTMTLLFESKEARDAAAASGMTDGMSITYQTLDRLLVEIGSQ